MFRWREERAEKDDDSTGRAERREQLEEDSSRVPDADLPSSGAGSMGAQGSHPHLWIECYRRNNWKCHHAASGRLQTSPHLCACLGTRASAAGVTHKLYAYSCMRQMVGEEMGGSGLWGDRYVLIPIPSPCTSSAC